MTEGEIRLFIGHTRFSMFVPGMGAWRTSDGTVFASSEDYKKHLYSDERLAVRSALFFDLSLPLLARAATGHPVIHMVSYSSSLPEKYVERLKAAAEQYPFLRLDARDDGQVAEEPSNLLRREYPEQELVFAEYRLDDDDLLAADFFDQLMPYVTNAEVGRYVSLASGLTALYADGKFYDARQCRQPMVAIGLARICSLSADGTTTTPPLARHSVADTAAPVVLDSRRPAYLWTRHIGQDTAVVHTNSLEKSELQNRLAQGLGQFPAVTDWAEVERHFPGLVERMTASSVSGGASIALISKRVRVTRAGLDLEVPGLSGSLQYDAHIRSSSPSGSRDLRIVFHFQYADGTNAVPGEAATSKAFTRLLDWGTDGASRLAASLRTSSGLASTRGKVEVPDGSRLIRVTLEPDSDRFSTGFLERLDVTSTAGHSSSPDTGPEVAS